MREVITDGIDIAPVSLHLGVLEGITIDLAGAGEEEPGADPLRQSEHVQSPNHIGLVPSQRLRLTQTISRKKLQAKTLDQSPFWPYDIVSPQDHNQLQNK